MARSLSEAIEGVKDNLGQRTFWLMDIHLKADGDYEAQDFYFSSQAVSANEHNYEPLLKSKPGVKFSLGAASDGGDANIDNTDFTFGQIIVPKDRFIQGSSVKVWFAWKLSNGTIATDQVFEGEIQNGRLSVGNKTVNLKIISDLYNPQIVLGAFPLAQRCVHLFNTGGVLSPEESLCGWQEEQGGNPDFCDQTEDGPDGCAAHFNLHRIGAITFFANVVVQIVQSSEESSGFQQVGRVKENPDIEPVYPELYR